MNSGVRIEWTSRSLSGPASGSGRWSSSRACGTVIDGQCGVVATCRGGAIPFSQNHLVSSNDHVPGKEAPHPGLVSVVRNTHRCPRENVAQDDRPDSGSARHFPHVFGAAMGRNDVLPIPSAFSGSLP